jgi:hypothetical protein
MTRSSKLFRKGQTLASEGKNYAQRTRELIRESNELRARARAAEQRVEDLITDVRRRQTGRKKGAP